MNCHLIFCAEQNSEMALRVFHSSKNRTSSLITCYPKLPALWYMMYCVTDLQWWMNLLLFCVHVYAPKSVDRCPQSVRPMTSCIYRDSDSISRSMQYIVCSMTPQMIVANSCIDPEQKCTAYACVWSIYSCVMIACHALPPFCLGVWGEFVNHKRSLTHRPSSQGWAPRHHSDFVIACLYTYIPVCSVSIELCCMLIF